MINYNGMLCIKNENGKYGLFDKNLNIIIPFEYDDILDFIEEDDGNNFLYAVQGSLTGKLNIKTAEFIPDTEDNEDTSLIKTKNSKYGLKNNDNSVLLPLFDKVEPWKNCYVSENRYLIYKDDKTGVAGEHSVLTQPVYNFIDNFDLVLTEFNPYNAHIASKDGYYGYIDGDGKPLSGFEYLDLKFPLTNKIGSGINRNFNGLEFINLETGKIIYSDINNKIVYYSTNFEYLCIYLNNNSYKVINSDGEIISEFIGNKNLNSAYIAYLNEKVLQYGHTYSQDNIRCGLTDFQGNTLTETIYRKIIPVKDTDLLVCECLFGNKSEITDSEGNVIIKDIYWIYTPFPNDGYERLPISYWKNQDMRLDEIFQYPENTDNDNLFNKEEICGKTEEEQILKEITEIFSDKDNICIVTDNGEPYIYVAENDKLSVYDRNKNILKSIDFKISDTYGISDLFL